MAGGIKSKIRIQRGVFRVVEGHVIFRARQFTFEFPRPTVVMGIVNVTPDSFSDGGQYLDVERAVAHGLELAAQGAEILDIGGESTRPGAAPVPEAEEMSRVVPVIEKLAARTAVTLSVDTVKPAVARAAVAAGASIVNDVAANRTDDALWRCVAEAGAGYICMHMQGTPRTMQAAPHYADVVAEVRAFFAERLEHLAAAGVRHDQVAFDPGIGFGKTLEHNLQLLGALGNLTTTGRPLVLGVSRKSFIGQICAAEVSRRLPGSLACAALAVAAGVPILRVHDVAETVQAVRVAEAVLKQRN
jgi:dihydropteroate synthase